MNKDPLYSKLSNYLSKNHLKSTKQRDAIVATFFNLHDRHVRIEDLLDVVRKKNPDIGYATVYRTLKLLVAAGVANQSHFNDGQSRFEVSSSHHHDHIICTECNKIVEFENDEIEELQHTVAKKLKFNLTGHKMELYGVCPACQKNCL